MRTSLLLLLAAVLLVRGWAGEAMAGEMLQQQLRTADAAAASVVHGPDCAGAMEGLATTDESSACGSCLHCQDCSLNAMTPAAPLLQGAAPVGAHREHPIRFASAEPLRSDKPPIA